MDKVTVKNGVHDQTYYHCEHQKLTYQRTKDSCKKITAFEEETTKL